MGEDEVRRLILARRAKFVAAALTVGAASSGCDQPQVCLSVSEGRDASSDGDGGDASADANPQPCLSIGIEDASADAARSDAGSDADAAPQPCLSVAIDAGSDADAAPQPCLSPPFDGG